MVGNKISKKANFDSSHVRPFFFFKKFFSRFPFVTLGCLFYEQKKSKEVSLLSSIELDNKVRVHD